MEWIKNGGQPPFVPDTIPDEVQPAGDWQIPRPVSYETWQPQAPVAVGEPKSLQIIYETFASSDGSHRETWHFFEGLQGHKVNPCDKGLFEVEGAPLPTGPDLRTPPWINVSNKFFRPSGYAQDCRFEGLSGIGPSGDVAVLP